uniref:Uncharacterized protein n=1 Tax=Aegilops tauschii subsp. strangulata TaxID=200361 RepID=A0A453E5Y4_AEGTS
HAAGRPSSLVGPTRTPRRRAGDRLTTMPPPSTSLKRRSAGRTLLSVCARASERASYTLSLAGAAPSRWPRWGLAFISQPSRRRSRRALGAHVGPGWQPGRLDVDGPWGRTAHCDQPLAMGAELLLYYSSRAKPSRVGRARPDAGSRTSAHARFFLDKNDFFRFCSPHDW